MKTESSKKRGRPKKVKQDNEIVIEKPIEQGESISTSSSLAIQEPPNKHQQDDELVDIESYINDLVEQKIAIRMRGRLGPPKRQTKKQVNTSSSFNPAYLLPVVIPIVKFGVDAVMRYSGSVIAQSSEVKKTLKLHLHLC